MVTLGLQTIKFASTEGLSPHVREVHISSWPNAKFPNLRRRSFMIVQSFNDVLDRQAGKCFLDFHAPHLHRDTNRWAWLRGLVLGHSIHTARILPLQGTITEHDAWPQ